MTGYPDLASRLWVGGISMSMAKSVFMSIFVSAIQFRMSGCRYRRVDFNLLDVGQRAVCIARHPRHGQLQLPFTVDGGWDTSGRYFGFDVGGWRCLDG